MQKNHWLFVHAMIGAILLLSTTVYADDLLQVYDQALAADPVFAQAHSTWKSQKMNLPIARAAYLPAVTVRANGSRNYVRTHYGSPVNAATHANTWQYDYSLSLEQPILNIAAWASIKNAGASVKAATAAYLAAQQSVIQRTATAYFNVLQAYDRLRYTIANKRAVWQQYLTAREQFRVGLIAITDEYDARSRYDQVVADQIGAQNNLNIQLENLRAITGHDYVSLKGLGKLPLYSPQPDNMDRWVSVATEQNYELKAQNYTVIAAMHNIRQQAAGGYPTVNLQGSYGDSYVDGNPPNTVQNSGELGLALTYKPIQGGLVYASTKQARYNYVTASGKLEQVYRNVINQTRSSFLSVLSFISKVQADQQNIISKQNALSATQAGFHVGTRTMTDVLNDLSSLYQAQQQYANDQYAYINNLISLKAAAGTLGVDDLKEINTWLGKSIAFPEQLSVASVPTENGKPETKLDDQKTSKKITPSTEKPLAQLPMPDTLPVAHLAKLAPPRQMMLPAPG